MGNIKIPIKDCIIPMYDDVLTDIMKHKYTHYTFPGGRGSTKSSFVGGIVIPLLIMANPTIHAVCFRKVANTIQTSIFPQVVWGIHQLGLDSLFHIPKTYSTPIVYKPTGQRIIFMGLDDPMKVKSIKLPFGYIGVTWFEELDQFAGENELRTVLQSTMRGGEKFWDFRTFNPPISKNNWANEYADSVEFDLKTNPNSQSTVIRNTYLDVPEDWLGQQFIDEAEELKAKNPRAYQHEYMGEAIGTGGDVFPNVEAIDMSVHNPIRDYNGNIVGQTPLISTFDNIYNGIDWGFALDPFRFVKMHFDRARLNLYIYREYTATKTRNETIFKELYEEKKLVRKDEQIIADSAEPKSIADFKAYGAFIRGAKKGPESVREGIKWLQGLNHIYIDRVACPETYKEFSNYEYEQDKDGNFISAYPDKDNHSIDSVRYAMERYWMRKGN
jgi:PBSX family phage terminase large subunit